MGSLCRLFTSNIFAISIFLLTLLGCSAKTESPVYVVNGKSYGVIDGVFRDRFWHYYERGVSYAEGSFFKEALADFDHAIELRAEDQRRARTYGMHFVDYFPNREKGVVLFEMGLLGEAKENLEKSLKQFPSAKANFYLDLVHKKSLESNIKSNKMQKSYPKIVLKGGVKEIKKEDGKALSFYAVGSDKFNYNNTLPEEIWTNDDPVLIRGDIQDSAYISEVSINKNSIFQEHASQNIELNYPMMLEQGSHKLTVTAKNLIGLESNKIITVNVDREGPVVFIKSIKHDPNKNSILVTASIYDESGIDKLAIKRDDKDEQLIPYDQSKESFSFKVADNIASVVVVASDLLENQTVAKISIKPTKISWLNNRGGTLVADTSGDTSLVKALFGNNQEKEYKSTPVISIPDWEEPQTVYLEKVYLDGEVTDDQQIKSLTINGIEKLQQPAQQLFFNHLVRLKAGENKITLSAIDEKGNISNREFTIVRNIADAFQSENRLSLSVMPINDPLKRCNTYRAISKFIAT
ncbi:MAG: hypothetical protein HQK74_11560 [Desulfamplus sp.]|nr:hypothetical protein [Desulfamplus sp.]